jgi:hypothetical protein
VKHCEFGIGQSFFCGGNKYRCTDVGTRTIIAIRVDPVEVAEMVGQGPVYHRTLSEAEAGAAGWFNGPPYALLESVFDEYDQEACSLEPEEDDEGGGKTDHGLEWVQ